jgi:hypothetical protein
VDFIAGVDDLEKTFLTPPGLELRPLGRPARSYSLYRLRYPGSKKFQWTNKSYFFLVGKSICVQGVMVVSDDSTQNFGTDVTVFF